MRLNERKLYIIKQSNDIIWKFSYSENIGITYRVFQKNKWSDCKIVTNTGTENFSVVLLSDNSICVLYQDISGHINSSKYIGDQWKEQQILKNEQKELFNIYLKAVVSYNHIHIIYNVFNKKAGNGTLFHQVLDEENNLSDSKVIDTIKFHYEIPFNVYTLNNKEIFIIYQKLTNDHEIGYRVFNNKDKVWSDFYMIDKSVYPYKDYSILINRDNLHVLYIKAGENTNSLNYAYGSYFNFNYNNILESMNIDSCSFFIVYDHICCSWVQENSFYSSFSIDNGNNFSTLPHRQLLPTSDIIKAAYLSNNRQNIRGLILNEMYVIDEKSLKYLIISDIYPNINTDESSDNCLSYMAYYIDKINELYLLYEKKINENEKLIKQIKYSAKEEKIKCLLYEKKFEEINKTYTKFKEGKKILNENINYLQESLILKEEKINELENINLEKENEISCVKKKLSEQECRILSFVEEIKNLKNQIEDLNLQLSVSNSKLNNSLLKRIFNNE